MKELLLCEDSPRLLGQDLSKYIYVAKVSGPTISYAVPSKQKIRLPGIGVEATLSRLGERTVYALEEMKKEREAAKDVTLEAAREAALAELDAMMVVEQIKQAINQKRMAYVRYQPVPQDAAVTHHLVCLDIKPGRTPGTQANDYLWAYSYEYGSTVSLRLDRVLGVELSEETFDPAELLAGWEVEPEWNLPRDWNDQSGQEHRRSTES